MISSSSSCRQYFSALRALVVTLILGIGTAFNSGCASIVHGGDRAINVATVPPGAKATFTRADTGETVTINTTPCVVRLDPKGGYFKGQRYKLHLELAGYQPVDIAITPSLSAWYAGGNLLFGGLIGYIVVDPLTGSMWNLTPDRISSNLSASTASLIKNGQGFVVVLYSQTSAGERAHLVRLN